MSPAPDPGKILTPTDLADRWRVTADVVAQMCRDGRLPGAFKAGREWRISTAALHAYELGHTKAVA